MLYGVNIHQKPYSSAEVNYNWSTIPRAVDAAASCGFKAVRVDCANETNDVSAPKQIARVPKILSLCKDRGLKSTLVYISPFKFNRTDGGVFADTSAGRYQMGYTLLKQLLQACPVKPDYIELENEIALNVTPKMLWSEGQVAADFEVTRYLEYVDLLAGELAAVREVAPTTKVIVGTIQGNYAFIPWLISKGIAMDIAGYHLYMRPSDSVSNWFTLGKSLSQIFSAWGLPVSINEINGNVSLGQPTMGQQAVRAVADIKDFPMVESFYAYELFDSVAEPGFGICDLAAGNFTVRTDQAGFVASLK